MSFSFNTNPLTPVAGKSTAEKDKELWKKWKDNPNEENLRALLAQTANIRHQAIQNWTGSISPVSLNSEAVRISVMAFNSYNPNMGVQLSTHLTNSLQKLSREAYKEVSFLRIPEERQMKYQSFSMAREDLRDRLGRDASPNELADELGWKPNEIKRFLSEDRSVLLDNQPLPHHMAARAVGDNINVNDPLHYVVADMPETDKLIFSHTTGYGGYPVLSGAELMKKVNMTQSQISYRKRIITNQISQVRGKGN